MIMRVAANLQHVWCNVRDVWRAQIECCIRCLAQGVGAAHIIDGRAKHSILMELLTDEGVGTMITG
jgi:acetylglutamate kinase